MRPFIRIGLIAAVTLPLLISASAQTRYRTTDPGRWRAWKFDAIPDARKTQGATAADVKAFEARLLEFGDIVRRSPAVAQPVGFSVGPHGYLAGQPALGQFGPKEVVAPLAGGYGFGAFGLFEYDRNGKTIREEGAETELLYFEVNQLRRGVYDARQPEEWHGQDIEAFFEPVAATPVAGHPRYGKAVVIKKNPKPLWTPIALDTAMAPALAVLRAQHEVLRDSYAKNLEEFNSTLTPEARARRRATLEETAKLLPNGPEFLKEAEAADREIETTQRRELAPGGPQDRAVKEAERLMRDAAAALDARSPEQRAAAACYDERGTTVARKFLTVQEAPSGCRPLVAPNSDYFNPALPRSAPQVVMLWGYATCLEPESLASKRIDGCTVNRKLVETMDWDAVKAWLDR